LTIATTEKKSTPLVTCSQPEFISEREGLIRSTMTRQPTIRANFDASQPSSGTVSVSCLGPEIAGLLARSARSDDLLKSIFRVTVLEDSSHESIGIPDVIGRYRIMEDEVEFIPHFPFEHDVEYRVSFDPRPLGSFFREERSYLDFAIPAEQQVYPPARVNHVFPSGEVLPENLLRFYVCFSDSMQHGHVAEHIFLLDSAGCPVSDVLYRAPLELWDRTMRHLTVLLDPGRLKRWVGPNVELGPPLKAGQDYSLEVGSGMADLFGRPLCEPFRKRFRVAEPVRNQVSTEHWELQPPETGSRRLLTLSFPEPLDWALLQRMITIESEDGSTIDGAIVIDQCERRWNFAPELPWMPGKYRVRVNPGLEDVCGNNLAGAFERPLSFTDIRDDSSSSLFFQLAAT